MKLSENALPHAARGRQHGETGFINKPATLAYVDRTTKSFDVRKAKRDPEAVSLSGGNLQKFQVGREILREPGILVVSQPTWGVDARRQRRPSARALVDLAGAAAPCLVISQDLDEFGASRIADRIAVMFLHGKLSALLEAAAMGDARTAWLIDGRRQRRERGRGARGEICSWCLNAARNARRRSRLLRR